MKLSYKWLNEYVDLTDTSPEELAQLLTMKTCEVEHVGEFWHHLKNFPVAQVLSTKKHPDADKLTICETDTGNGIIQIVTGAPNVKSGKKYPLAGVGVTLPSGITMKPARLRGQESLGMLCSAAEIELTQLQWENHAEDGLLTLPDAFKTGEDLRTALGATDHILDIDNKSITHRPDLWCHFGFAREIAALLGKDLIKNPLQTRFRADKALANNRKISIEENSAIRYSGAVIHGFSIKPSALSLQIRLCAVGQKPLNNVIDISNYVLLEIGQPNHAFDAEKLDSSILVSRAKKNETLTTLDGNECVLPEGAVVIRSEGKPVALAGIMGGLGTEVTPTTKMLFLESACFHRADIRSTVSKTGIRSESSQRFEKGQNPEKCDVALHRFAELLAQTEQNLKMSEISVAGIDKRDDVIIEVSLDFLRQKSGIENLTEKTITDILLRLGMIVTETKPGVLSVKVPEWRSMYDITIPEDILEEIGRITGYQEIPRRALFSETKPPVERHFLREYKHHLRNTFSLKYHFTEVYNYAFHSETDITADNRFSKNAMQLKNSIQAELKYMRVSPIPGLLRNLENNHRENTTLRYFETERIFIPGKDSLPNEKVFFAAVMLSPEISAEKNLEFLSSIAAEIFQMRGIDIHELSIDPGKDTIFHQGRCGTTKYATDGQNAEIRWGQLHPKLTESYKISSHVWYLEFFPGDLLWLWRGHFRKYHPPERFPGNQFELTLVCPERTEFREIRNLIPVVSYTEAGNVTHVGNLEYLTSFRGEQLGAGVKAVSLRISLQNFTRTLQSKEIAEIQTSIIKMLEKNGFKLR